MLIGSDHLLEHPLQNRDSHCNPTLLAEFAVKCKEMSHRQILKKYKYELKISKTMGEG